MRGIVLTDCGLIHPQPAKLPGSIASHFVSLNVTSLPKFHPFRLASRSQNLGFSRWYRKCGEMELLECFPRKRVERTQGRNGQESAFFVCKNCKETKDLAWEVDGCSRYHSKSLMTKRRRTNVSIAEFVTPSCAVKSLIIFGLLTLQVSQPALAGIDVASGLRSISSLGDLGDISTGFASAFLLIFFSELGDKTFFIAALLAARNSGAVVFIGTFGALAAMTIISVVLGRTFHYVDEILPFRFGEADLPIDDIAAVCLLVYFGVSTLLDAASSNNQKAEEEQKEAELAVSEFSGNGAGILATANTVISTFLLVFVAEWGDKSFFSTIALAAASSPLGVVGGALAGHAVATLLAVVGGSLLGTFLSEKAIAYIGGVLFLVFATVTLIEIVS